MDTKLLRFILLISHGLVQCLQHAIKYIGDGILFSWTGPVVRSTYQSRSSSHCKRIPSLTLYYVRYVASTLWTICHFHRRSAPRRNLQSGHGGTWPSRRQGGAMIHQRELRSKSSHNLSNLVPAHSLRL